MKTDASGHDCHVGRAPWAGVHSVRTESVRHFGRHWHDTFGIGVLDKAVGVLHAVADSPCGLAELFERTGLPRATAHRLACAARVRLARIRLMIDARARPA